MSCSWFGFSVEIVGALKQVAEARSGSVLTGNEVEIYVLSQMPQNGQTSFEREAVKTFEEDAEMSHTVTR